MTAFDYFLWVLIPYLSLTIFVVGHIHRYNYDQYGWGAKSSEFLQKDNLLKWGSILFHYGVIFVFFGHVAGVLIPKGFYDVIGVSEHMYHFGALWFGGAAGLAMVIGGALLTIRRVNSTRLKKQSSVMDVVVLLILGLVTVIGFSNTVGYTASGGMFDYRAVIGPWFRGILTFRPYPELMAAAPLGFQLHILAAFVLFAVWPYTRLVHVWSLPLEYLSRKYIVYRKMNPKKAVKYEERN
ncbi:respiratory nitrate reductase subunit gamma [Schinkia azotoformans]|uniref:Respiratory nitrate reductase subunit gamma n=1 Tax=Schinkia azotoformans LMG 9581 TaxID=1131731 RepID=K6D423_SCHAZ|nr:respiratory nitrate reductase subunit gamma [Schinkia azotoformans]EKN67262.1 respiratory nitrate reductase subunit gamma [Schinkia azotoformans LMG 9581]MEC1639488.1 respiratory nitrate reductase subunit gamma [Schinkia azotoformans]MEC1944258.1 respiratory nitrate reductase subunit gamma [Schinkia azotoformans]